MDENTVAIVSEFTEEAKAFCALVDGHASLSRDEWLSRMQAALPSLYAAGLRLPLFTPLEFPDDELRQSINDWADLLRALREFLGPIDVYWTVFDPRLAEESTAAHLSGDIADIYRDLGEGLMLSDRHAPPENVLWEWSFGFRSHWGRHAVGALHAIHWLSPTTLK